MLLFFTFCAYILCFDALMFVFFYLCVCVCECVGILVLVVYEDINFYNNLEI